MAPMQLGKKGWESTLSAFRIDGSEQLDIACLVAVCPDEACPNVSVRFSFSFMFGSNFF